MSSRSDSIESLLKKMKNEKRCKLCIRSERKCFELCVYMHMCVCVCVYINAYVSTWFIIECGTKNMGFTLNVLIRSLNNNNINNNFAHWLLNDFQSFNNLFGVYVNIGKNIVGTIRMLSLSFACVYVNIVCVCVCCILCVQFMYMSKSFSKKSFKVHRRTVCVCECF